MKKFKIKRIDDESSDDDGSRVLVDRLYPVEFLKMQQTSIVETRRLRHLLNSENGLNTKRHALRSLNGSTRKN